METCRARMKRYTEHVSQGGFVRQPRKGLCRFLLRRELSLRRASCDVEKTVSRRVHDPEVAGSNPAVAMAKNIPSPAGVATSDNRRGRGPEWRTRHSMKLRSGTASQRREPLGPQFAGSAHDPQARCR